MISAGAKAMSLDISYVAKKTGCKRIFTCGESILPQRRKGTKVFTCGEKGLPRIARICTDLFFTSGEKEFARILRQA
jgi:hypothetical protein